MNIRIETHKVEKHLGENGITPQGHLNIDVYNKNGNKLKMLYINKGHKLLE